MSRSLYVWYRVERDDPETEFLTRSMLARVACRSGVRGRLMRKVDEPRLWLEVYENVADPARFGADLEHALESFDLGVRIDGARHTEWFEETEVMSAACARAGDERG